MDKKSITFEAGNASRNKEYSTQEDDSKISSPNRTQHSMYNRQNMQIQESSNQPGSRGSSMIPLDDR